MTKIRCFLPTRRSVLRLVVIVAYEGMQLLDVSGPATVFAEAAAFLPDRPYEVVLVSPAGGPVLTEAGIALGTRAFADLGNAPIDTLLVPGADAAALARLLRDEVVRNWTRQAALHVARLTSVCTGAFALASWGLLDGRRATTHWAAGQEFKRRFPHTQLDSDALFVEDGSVWTSAGVSTGIDMALAMVERDLGKEVAAAIARRLVLQMRRPGHQSQFSPVLKAQAGSFGQLAEWISQHLTSDLTVEALATQMGTSPRSFHRRFSAEVGMTPAAFVERLRLDRARTLLEAGQTPKQAAAAAGFGTLDRLGRVFRRTVGLSPSAYRVIHAALE